MRTLFAALILLVVIPAPVVSQPPDDAATKEDVEQTLELTGVREQLHSMLAALAQSRSRLEAAEYRRKNPQASPAEVEKVEIATRQTYEAAMNSLNIDEMMDIVIPIYQRYFTHSDLLAINDFYASPVGQKVLKNSPAMMMEAMQAAQPIIQRRLAECQAAAEKAAREELKTETAAKSGDTSTSAAPATGGEAERVRLSRAMSEGLLLSQVQPEYPPLARQARVQGAVVLDARIGADGTVESVAVVSGHPMLIQAAMDAVKQWRYKSFLVNDVPVAVLTQITVNFQLQ